MRTAVTQVLVTVHHDGRFSGDEGEKRLADFVGGRAWTLDGVKNANSVLCNLAGMVSITETEYNRLRQLAKVG